MLIDKGISAGSVVTLKLVSGEEIIAKYVEDSSDSIKISKPMSLSMSPKGLGMMPFAFTVGGDKDISVFKTAVIMISVTDKQFADQFIQSTTGIALG
jgi:hypothetical protein